MCSSSWVLPAPRTSSYQETQKSKISGHCVPVYDMEYWENMLQIKVCYELI